MGFDCNLFFEQTANAIARTGYSFEEASHAISELSKAAKVYGRSPVGPSTIVRMSIVRKPVLKIDGIKSATLTVDNVKINWDVLENNFGPFNKGDIVFHK